MSPVSITIIAAAVTVVILGIIGAFWIWQNPLSGLFGGNTDATQPSTEATEWTGPTVPNYLGKTYDEAVKEAKDNSSVTILKNYTDEYSDEYKEGTVMQQNPPAGSKITSTDDGAAVNISLTISKGAKMRELPSVEGLALEKASETIAGQGLLGTPEYQYNDKYAEGIVVGYKDKSVGETVEYGTNVTLIVSKGKEPVGTDAE